MTNAIVHDRPAPAQAAASLRRMGTDTRFHAELSRGDITLLLDCLATFGRSLELPLQMAYPEQIHDEFLENALVAKRLSNYLSSLADSAILYGDPILGAWVLDGAPVGAFDWTGDFSDVVAAEDRDDYVGV